MTGGSLWTLAGLTSTHLDREEVRIHSLEFPEGGDD